MTTPLLQLRTTSGELVFETTAWTVPRWYRAAARPAGRTLDGIDRLTTQTPIQHLDIALDSLTYEQRRSLDQLQGQRLDIAIATGARLEIPAPARSGIYSQLFGPTITYFNAPIPATTIEASQASSPANNPVSFPGVAQRRELLTTLFTDPQQPTTPIVRKITHITLNSIRTQATDISQYKAFLRITNTESARFAEYTAQLFTIRTGFINQRYRIATGSIIGLNGVDGGWYSPAGDFLEFPQLETQAGITRDMIASAIASNSPALTAELILLPVVDNGVSYQYQPHLTLGAPRTLQWSDPPVADPVTPDLTEPQTTALEPFGPETSFTKMTAMADGTRTIYCLNTEPTLTAIADRTRPQFADGVSSTITIQYRT